MAIRFTPKLLPSRKGNLGIFELNNPKPLHALSLDMINCMTDVWKEWMTTDVSAFLVKSSPDSKVPAFCAGGDVKAVYQAGINGQGHGNGSPGMLTADFFRNEYTLNYLLAKSEIPQISFWNGLVMGGGAGISVHGKYRISTEHTVFAMPETTIGLFCDVGSTWWMPRKLNGGLAKYLALTGARLHPNDLLYTGIATHYVPSEQLPKLEAAIVEATESIQASAAGPIHDVIAPLLMSYHQILPVEESFLARNRSWIDASFQETSIEAIVSNLERMDNEFSQKTLQTISKLSPKSLKITLEGLLRGAACTDISQALTMEFRMSQACMKPGSDFYEGIRAVLVDKDQNPQWSPALCQNVTEDMVESHFAPLVDDNEWHAPVVGSHSSKL
jgi:enoyl-CoA hydratase/carnithine racemase